MSDNKRKLAQDFIITYIQKILPGKENSELYNKLFSDMSDEDFSKFIDDLESGKTRLAIINPNFSKNKLEVSRNLAIAKELKHNFFQRVWIPEKKGVPSHLTPIKYLVIDLPLRRQAQLLDKKISIPEDNNSIDNLTGQPTGKSKGSKISFPELQILAALNLEKSITEMIKYRGGDEKGYNAMTTSIARTGSVSLNAIEPFSGEVKSTQALRTLLSGMHLKNSL